MSIEDLYSKYLECGCKVTTDSRAIGGGEMFFAIKGENFDGNDYALKALEAGASFAVVNSSSAAAAASDDRIIAVDDTLKCLTQLANYHRNNCLSGGERLRVIGLTGTNGKTTTKELIRSVLSAKYRVTATEGNLNNDIGVPLSLLKITPETELAVIEMGANHPDDIVKLVRVVEPDSGLITTVGKGHLLGFGSFEGVKKAKGALYDFLAEVGGTIFLNEDDTDLRAMSAERNGIAIVPYGPSYDGAEILPVTAESPFLRIQLGSRCIRTKLVGAYNAVNVLAAICIGRYFEVPFEDACAAVEAYTPANSRSQMQRTDRNVLIMDAYNANPSSMTAALNSFAAIQADCKIALLGDMRELGADSLQEHIGIVRKLSELGLKAWLVGEEFTKALARTGSCDAVYGVFADSDALAAYLKEHPLQGATVLVKGSRGIRMEKVVPEL